MKLFYEYKYYFLLIALWNIPIFILDDINIMLFNLILYSSTVEYTGSNFLT